MKSCCAGSLPTPTHNHFEVNPFCKASAARVQLSSHATIVNCESHRGPVAHGKARSVSLQGMSDASSIFCRSGRGQWQTDCHLTTGEHKGNASYLVLNARPRSLDVPRLWPRLPHYSTFMFSLNMYPYAAAPPYTGTEVQYGRAAESPHNPPAHVFEEVDVSQLNAKQDL